jgi:serine/threonine protein kinase
MLVAWTQVMQFRAGETIGDYAILGVLGTGGMGRVFRVRNILSDRIEAMKVVLQDAAADSALAERFLREIKVHASLEHPNIAAMRTALRVEDRIVMIMELVTGASLGELLRDGPLDPQRAVAYAGQVLSALGYAHAHGVVHRDIKPANIIVTPRGTVKVTDFGIAQAGGGGRLTKTGAALGSIHYMSPEHIQGFPCDARSDIYSMGVTLYEMVTGIQPIRGENEYAIMHGHLAQTPPPASELVSTVPAELSAIIAKAMAKAPEERFQSAGEFRAALGISPDGVPVPEAVPEVYPTSQPPQALDTALLAQLESHLVRVMGPIARHLITKASREAASVEELCRILAQQVPDQRERDTFLRSFAKTATAPRTATGSPPHQGAIGAEVMDETTRKLAVFMGPVAGVMVKRAARKVHSIEELYSMLAAEIPSDRDRASFLSSLGK